MPPPNLHAIEVYITEHQYYLYHFHNNRTLFYWEHTTVSAIQIPENCDLQQREKRNSLDDIHYFYKYNVISLL